MPGVGGEKCSICGGTIAEGEGTRRSGDPVHNRCFMDDVLGR